MPILIRKEEQTQIQSKPKLIFKKPIFPFKQNSPTTRLDSPVEANRKKSILKKRLKKANSSQVDSTDDDFETFMNLFNSSKNTKKRSVNDK